ncbi:GET complex subunit get1 [Dispira simplex]|nr:GET complex subunit get1 [Dispira simplex]
MVQYVSFTTSFPDKSDSLWQLYRRTCYGAEVQKQQKLKQDIVTLKTELRQTTAQDEFAKWAKLKRRLDKSMAAYDAHTSQVAFAKSAFELKATLGLRISLYGLRTFLFLWYRATPVFYLPNHWFDPVSAWLAYPLAPVGSVSVPVWMFVCHRVCRHTIHVAQKSVRQVVRV